MKYRVTRRSFLLRLAGGAALIISGGLSWLKLSERRALGAVRWSLRAPLTGQVAYLNYHSDNALDFFAADETKVKLFILSDAYGIGWAAVNGVQNSCSTGQNPTHKRVLFSMHTDGNVFISTGVASHIKTSLVGYNVVAGNGGLLGKLDGANAVVDCYDPYHVHFGAPGMSHYGGPWPQASVTAAQSQPWEKYV